MAVKTGSATKATHLWSQTAEYVTGSQSSTVKRPYKREAKLKIKFGLLDSFYRAESTVPLSQCRSYKMSAMYLRYH